MMRILFVIHTPKDRLTAVYGNTVERAEFLKHRGHDVKILSPEDFPRLKRVPARLLPLVYPLALLFRLAREAREYDLINFHSYSGWAYNLCRKFIDARASTRVMTMFHGLEPLYYKSLKSEMARIGKPLSLRYRLIHGALMPRLIRLSCRRSDVVACLNSTEAAYRAEHGWANRSQIAMTPNSIGDSFFIKRELRPDVRRILFVGQWIERKGISNLIGAFTHLARSDSKLSLWCVGTLISEEVVLAAFPEDVRPRVTVRPRVSRDEIVGIYKEADVFVFPTLFEGFSLALLEAMAAALPIVATRVGSAPDILETGVSALLISENDTGSLIDALRRLTVDATLRESLGRQAQASAGAYRQERVYKNYLALLEDLVAGAGAKKYAETMIELS
jgi:glycosyltransferase involved in cell wall biosynthesis